MKKLKILALFGLIFTITGCGPTTNPTTETSVNPTTSEDKTTTVDTETSIDPAITGERYKAFVYEQERFNTTSGNFGTHGITYEAFQGGGTAEPIVSDGYIRIYQAASGNSSGGYIKLSFPSNVISVSVEIGSAMSTTVGHTFDESYELSPLYDIEENGTHSVTGVTSDSISFHCMGADKNHRLYVNYIKLNYIIDNEMPGTSVSVPPIKSEWSSEETQLMKENLAGNVLPFYDFETYEMYWDTTYYCVSIESSLGAAHVAFYSEVLIGDGYQASYSEDGYNQLLKALDDIAFLVVDVYVADAGTLCVDAFIYEYLTEWPSAEVDYFLTSYGIEGNVPGYNGADTYEFVDYTDYYGCVAVYCYTSDTSAESNYSNTLEAANFTVYFDSDAEIYYAVDPANSFEVDYYYDASSAALAVFVYSETF